MSNGRRHRHNPPQRGRRRTAMLLATLSLLVWVAAGSSATAGSRDIKACAQKKRAAEPGLTYVAAVVRCVKIASARTTMTLQWTTCAERTATPGERCESGSVLLGFRTKHSQANWRIKDPRGAQGWHLVNGTGTIACTRDRHDVASGDPRARREGRGSVSHIDAVVWPTGAAGKVSVAVSQYPNGGIGKWKGDAGQVCPYWAFAPSSTSRNTAPSTSFAATRLFAPMPITYETASSTSTQFPVATISPEDGPVGSKRIRVTTRSTTTITFTLGPGQD